MAEWNIKPRATQCAACNTPFEPGQKGHSLLVPAEGGPERRDYCQACYKGLPKATVQQALSGWAFTLTQRAVKPKGREEPVRRETAEHLLRVLTARGNPEDRDVVYVLAILLERNKQLVERSVTVNEAGLKLRHYEQRGTGDLFTICDPELRPEGLATVQQRVVDLLEGKPLTEEPPPVRRVRRTRFTRRSAARVVRHWRPHRPGRG